MDLDTTSIDAYYRIFKYQQFQSFKGYEQCFTNFQ